MGVEMASRKQLRQGCSTHRHRRPGNSRCLVVIIVRLRIITNRQPTRRRVSCDVMTLTTQLSAPGCNGRTKEGRGSMLYAKTRDSNLIQRNESRIKGARGHREIIVKKPEARTCRSCRIVTSIGNNQDGRMGAMVGGGKERVSRLSGPAPPARLLLLGGRVVFLLHFAEEDLERLA